MIPGLGASLNDYIKQEDIRGVINPARREWMARHLEQFVESAVLKFIAGQIEHGEGIEQCDLLREMSAETIDLFWYLTAKRNPLK